MSKDSCIRFFFKDISFFLADRKKLKTYIAWVFSKEGGGLQYLNYVFCTDKEILKINKTYLKHNYYTDTISFNLSENPREILGEVYISIERVRENALVFKTSFKKELLRVMFHGALHLCGYKDKSKKEKQAIHDKEEYYMSLYFKQ